MDKKLDAKIKQILQENDDIVVPRNISKGIDETLKSLSNKRVKKEINAILKLENGMDYIKKFNLEEYIHWE